MAIRGRKPKLTVSEKEEHKVEPQELTAVQETEESIIEDVASEIESPARIAFKQYIAEYEVKHPEKWYAKKDELEKKLSQIQ